MSFQNTDIYYLGYITIKNIYKKMIDKRTLNDYGNICNSCTIYIVSFVIAFLIIISTSSAFIYFHWYLKEDNTIINKINSNTET